MSDVEPDDDAEVRAPAVVVNDQDINHCHQLSTKAFYGVLMPKGERSDLKDLDHTSAVGNSKVGQIAPSIRKTRRECLPPRRYNN